LTDILPHPRVIHFPKISPIFPKINPDLII
jgi:hypothetical protein